MFCRQCGSQIDDNADFCRFCGADMRAVKMNMGMAPQQQAPQVNQPAPEVQVPQQPQQQAPEAPQPMAQPIHPESNSMLQDIPVNPYAEEIDDGEPVEDGTTVLTGDAYIPGHGSGDDGFKTDFKDDFNDDFKPEIPAPEAEAAPQQPMQNQAPAPGPQQPVQNQAPMPVPQQPAQNQAPGPQFQGAPMQQNMTPNQGQPQGVTEIYKGESYAGAPEFSGPLMMTGTLPQPDVARNDANVGAMYQSEMGGVAVPPYNDVTNFGKQELRTNRTLLKYILLGIVTLGFYDLWVEYTIVDDLNTLATKHDGKKTMNLMLVSFFASITCGISVLVWSHKMSNRIGEELRFRNINYKFNAATFWLWNILGSFIIVGPFIYIHKLLKSMNLLCQSYNLYDK